MVSTRRTREASDLADDTPSPEPEQAQSVSSNETQPELATQPAMDSRQRSRMTPRSGIWSHFTKTLGSDGKQSVKCNSCDTSYTFSKNSGTTNLWRHYNSNHKNARFSQGTLTSGGTMARPEPMSAEENEALTKLLVSAIVDSSVSFSFVENDFFRKFVAKLNPRYDVPSRKMLTRRILAAYQVEISSMKSYLQRSVDGKMSFTTDAWSSRIFRSYMAITAHWIDADWNLKSTLLNFVRFYSPHTATNVKTLLLEELENWNISNKVMALTTDNGSEMVAGTTLLEAELDSAPIHVRCMAHVVNVAVKAAFEMIKSNVGKLRSLILAIRKSVKRRERFEKLKSNMGYDAVLLPSSDVKTRWSSTYYMLTAAVKAKPVLNALVLEITELSEFSITDTEWALAESMCEILKIFANVTENQSGKHYVTLSMYKGLFDMLLKSVSDFTEMQFGPLKDTTTAMRDKLKTYENYVSTDLTKLAIIMDPRFANDETRDDPFLRTQMTLHGYSVNNTFSESQETNNNLFATIFSQGATETPTQSSSEDEVGLFFKATRVKEHFGIDPLAWWKINEKRFPNVAKLARDILAVQASSVASESTFSVSGNLVSDSRTRLSDEVITAAMCLREWQRLRKTD